MNIIGLTEENYIGIGHLMSLGFVQDSEGLWNRKGSIIKLDFNESYELKKLLTEDDLNVSFGDCNIDIKICNKNLTSLKNLPNRCRNIDVSNNCINKIDKYIVAKNYDYSNNFIDEILCGFPEGIESLHLEFNSISVLENLPKKIRSLCLQFNKISNLDYLNDSDFKIQSLDIRHNEIADFDLSNLELSNFYFDYLENSKDVSYKIFPFVKNYLKYSTNETSFKYLNKHSINNVDVLNSKDLEVLELKANKEISLKNLPNLKDLTKLDCESLHISDCENVVLDFHKNSKYIIINNFPKDQHYNCYRHVRNGIRINHTGMNPIISNLISMISENDLTEKEFYLKVFERFKTLKNEKEIISNLESIVWPDCVDVSNYLNSLKGVNTFNL